MQTILLIEDNINILENLSEYLEIEGYKNMSESFRIEKIIFQDKKSFVIPIINFTRYVFVNCTLNFFKK